MLKQISLDDSSYEKIYGRAMEHIAAQAPWWTHREISDPGITLLEMWALLADMQSFYLDQIQESHYRKYLKLLGVRSHEGRCASAWVFFDGVGERCVLPRGTKLLADRMVFETEEAAELTPNSLDGFYLGESRSRIETMKLQRKTSFALPETGVLFAFSLKKAVTAGEKIYFYILVDEREKRNPAEKGFRMAELAWEYRTAGGWREARVMIDETGGLLFSGGVCLQLDRDMRRREGMGYLIRCRVKSGEFDVAPVLYKIAINVVKARQKNTLCCEEQAEIPAGGGRVALESYLAKTGRIRVMKQLRGELWKDITESCEIDPPITADRKERYVSLPGKAKVRFLCRAAELAESALTYPVTGIAGQQISLPWENVMRESAELLLAQEDTGSLYCACHRDDPEEDRYQNVWHWQEEGDGIILGDGRHGDIPTACDRGLLFTSLALWEGSKGNVSIGRIRQLERPELFPGITCSNLMTGWGGQNRRLPSEQFAEIRENLPSAMRMVTGEDIRKLAVCTPGLKIRDADVQWQDGVMRVTIIPSKPLKSAYCEELYRTRAESFLEKYRLVGSRIEVVVAKEG